MKRSLLILTFLLAGAMASSTAGQAASKTAAPKADGITFPASEMIGKDKELTGGHNREVRSVAFSPSGKKLASGGADPRRPFPGR